MLTQTYRLIPSTVFKASLVLCLLLLSPFASAETGSIISPLNNSTVTGNLLIVVDVAETDNTSNISLRIAGGGSMSICNSTCRDQRYVETGVPPSNLGARPGSNTLELVDNNSGLILDTASFNWSPARITGVTVDRVIGSFTVSWSPVGGFLRYNLYIASDSNITPDNIQSLPDSQAFRGLSGTSQVITGVDDALGMFALVTGVDSSGESAFSDIVRIEGLDNLDPVIGADSFTLNEDDAVSGNVLNNDEDPEGESLTAELLTPPNNGNLTLDELGNFSYSPNANFNGSDSFSYLAKDSSGGSAIGDVQLSVIAINDLPVVTPDNYQTDEDTSLSIPSSQGVLANDSDVESSSLTASLISSTNDGVLNFNSDGSFSYSPNENFFGEDGFTYVATDLDGASSQPASVVVTINNINDLPLAVDDNYTMSEDSELTVTASEGVLANDVDVDAENIVDEVSATIINSTSNGELSFSADGAFTYKPENNFFGSDSFVYQITDSQGASSSATVIITINDTNDTPTAEDDSFEVDEDSTLTVTAAQGLLANDSDGDGDSLVVDSQPVTSPANGELQLSQDGSFVYTPAENFFGTDVFVYKISDPAGASAQATASITVKDVNDPPKAEDDQFSGLEDTAIEVSDPAAGLLANDSDIDLTAEQIFTELSVSLVTAPTSGELNLATNGTFTYNPEANFFGSDSFVYAISDAGGLSSQATVSLTIEDVIDNPVAEDDNYAATEDETLSVNAAEGLLANDSSPDNGNIQFTQITTPPALGEVAVAGDGSFTYTPNENANGTDTFVYELKNAAGGLDTAVVTINIEAVNDAPVAQDDEASANENQTVTITPLDNDSDVDNDELTITSAQAENGTVEISSDAKSIAYTAPNSGSSDTITYVISDTTGATASASIAVQIAAVNDTPVANDDAASVEEDQAVIINVLSNDTDADGDTLTIVSATTNDGTVSITGTSVVYSPTLNFNGTASIEYSIQDPLGASDSATITVTVTPVNDAPVATDDTVSTTEDTPLTISPLQNDTDVENDPLIITSASSSNGTVTQPNSTSLLYTPSANFFGTNTINYAVSDQNGGTATGTITVTVTESNNAPVAVNDTANVFAGETVVISPLSNDTDADNETLSLVSASVDNGSLSVNANNISYTAPSNTSGTATITYTVADTRNAQATGTVTVTITEQALTGEFDSDGNGTSDVSTTRSGNNYVVTFGNDVDSVYYQENNETVSVSTNDSGVFEITIQSTANNVNSDPGSKGEIIIDNRDAKQSQRGVWTLDDFILGGANSVEVFFTIAGMEYSLRVSNLDQPNANVAFPPPTQLDTTFSGTEFDFFLKDEAFRGPLRTGAFNGQHYKLLSAGTSEFNGIETDSDVSWQIVNGQIVVNFINPPEHEVNFLNVFDLDDDNSDGRALGIITKAEADAYVAANNTTNINAFISDHQHTFTLVRDNRISKTVNVSILEAYRIDPIQHPTITSATTPVVANTPEIISQEMLDLRQLRILPFTTSDIVGDIAIAIPRLAQNGEFDRMIGDDCTLVETPANSNSGTGSCHLSAQTFTWTIDNGTLKADFSNGADVDYRWMDKLAVANTYVANIQVTVNSVTSIYSKMGFWLKVADATDTTLTTLLSGKYFDSSFTKTDPGAVDAQGNVRTENTFGFYFDASGLGKNMQGRIQDNVSFIRDFDRRWSLLNGDLKISSLSSLSSGNQFRYTFDQCTDSANQACFVWRVRTWVPIAIAGNKIWVIEGVVQHVEGPVLNTTINYQEFIPNRIQYYELNASVPGAPNSVSFNREPVSNFIQLTTPLNTPLLDIDALAQVSDPEGDTVSLVSVNPSSGSAVIDSNNRIDFTPANNFQGLVNLLYTVSDGINTHVTFNIPITVQGANTPPVAVNDSLSTFAGLETEIRPLVNDTDADNDTLTITSATATTGSTSIDPNGDHISYTSPAAFTGTDTISYTISDGNGGTATASVNVSVSIANLSGSYDVNQSGTNDFTVTNSANIYTVTFGSEVTSVYYQVNGKTYVSHRNADGSFSIVFDSTSSSIPTIFFVIGDDLYSFTPDNLSTSPTITFGTVTQLSNDFGTASSYSLISRHVSRNSALPTGFQNGASYELASNATGQYSSPDLSDGVTWSASTNQITVNFNSITERQESWSVYDLDDDPSNRGALNVITKSEADAFVAANGFDVITVHVADISQVLTGVDNHGYYFTANKTDTRRFRVDSATYPTITSANSGVNVQFGGELIELLNTTQFGFIDFVSSDVLSSAYLPIPRDNRSNGFSRFAHDNCSFTESSTGSNSGTGTCSIVSGGTFTWQILSDNALEMSFTNGITATLRKLNSSTFENTVFVKAVDGNSKVYSTLDYWAKPQAPSASAMSTLLTGNYLESGDILSNSFNYDPNGTLVTDLVHGFYFDGSTKAKSFGNFFANDIGPYIEDRDFYWEYATGTGLIVSARSNLSSSDTFKYAYSQCTLPSPGDASCFQWLFKTLYPFGIDGNRLWVMEYETEATGAGIFSSPLTINEAIAPKIRYYQVRSPIPGSPNSINFNQEPVVSPSSTTTPLNTPVTVNLLSTASDPEGDTLSLEYVQASTGTIVNNGNGTATYTPSSNYTGTVFISYRISDGISRVQRVFVINVTGANNAPTAVNDSALMQAGTTVTLSPLINDTDPDSDPLTITSTTTIAGTATIISGGTQIQFTETVGSGIGTINYDISDGNGGTSSAAISVTINRAPIANPDTASVEQGQSVTITPLTNDSDPDGNAMTITSASVTSGTGSVSIISGNTSLNYTAVAGNATSATISYTISDGNGGTSTSTITVTVNNSTVTAVSDTASVVQGISHTLTPLANDTDSDGDPLTITSASTNLGSVSINSGTTLTFSSPSAGIATINYSITDNKGGNASSFMTVTVGNQPVANADTATVEQGQNITINPLTNDTDSDGDTLTITSASVTSGTGSVSVLSGNTSLSYTAVAGNSGSAVVTYNIADGTGGTASSTVTITVTNTTVNAVNDTATVVQGVALNITPLTNDTDSDSDPLTISTASTDLGSVSINAGNTSLTFSSPTPGTATISYTATDGKGGSDTATVTVTVTRVPVANADTASVEQGQSVTISPLANDSDPDGDTITITAASVSSGTGSVSILSGNTTLSYTAPAGAATTETISYTISDGTGGTATANISVTVTNNTPVANADSYTVQSNGTAVTINSSVGVLINDTDPNADTITATIVTAPSQATSFNLNSDGSFSYQHNGSSNLSDSFTYSATDGTYSSNGTVSLTVKKANYAPEICTIPSRYAQVGEPFSQTFATTDGDNNAQTITVSGNPAWLTLSTINSSSSKLEGTPTSSDIGTSSTITVTTTDGFDSHSITFNVTVSDDFGASNNLNIEFGGTVESAHDAVLDNFGNIVIVGQVDGNFAVARLKKDGTFDSTFNSGAVKVIDFGGNDDKAVKVRIKPDNSIVVAGQTNVSGASNTDFAVAVLTSTGALDTNFSGDGLLTIDASQASTNDTFTEMLLDDAARITLVGQSLIGAVIRASLVRVLSNGTTDTSFGTSGYLSFEGVSSNDLNPQAATLTSEGHIYVVGSGIGSGANQDMFIAKINSGGLDTSFVPAAPAGIYYLDDTGVEEAFDFTFDREGKVLLVGRKDNDLVVFRVIVTFDGTSTYSVAKDTTFNGNTGILSVDLGNTSDIAQSIVSDKRGNFYVSAKSGVDTKVIKITPNGSLDNGYGSAGIKSIPLANGVANTKSVSLLDAAGQMLFIDSEDAGSNAHVSVTYDYILDPPTFGTCDGASEYESASHKTTDEVADAVVASDNSIYVVGHRVALEDSQKDFAVIKTSTTGELASNWGENGFAVVDSSSVSKSITPSQVQPLNNGAVIIAGVEASTTNLFVAKLNSSGKLDTGFNSTGINDFGAGDVKLSTLATAHVSSSDDFILMGKDNSSITNIYRFNSDGTEDNNFGAGASALSTNDAAANFTAYNDSNFTPVDLVRLSSGDLYIIGKLFVSDDETAVMKLDNNGLLQTAFGTSGAFAGIKSFSETGNFLPVSATTDNTNIYVLAYETTSLLPRVYKIDSTGNLVTAFGANGIKDVTNFKGTTQSKIHVDGNGKLWLSLTYGASTKTIVRLDGSGKFDTAFVNAGYAELTHGIGSWTNVAGFIVDGNNKALVYGHTNNDFAISPMDNTGLILNQHPNTFLDFGSGSFGIDVELDEYSSPVIAGYSFNSTDKDKDMSLVRFNNSGTSDSSFGTYGVGATAIHRYSPTTEESQAKALSISENGAIYFTAETHLSGMSNDNNVIKIKTLPGSKTQESSNAYNANPTDLNSMSNDLVGDHYLDDSGHLFVVGSQSAKGVVFKYDNGGGFNGMFNGSGTIELSAYTDSHLTSITTAADGDLVAVGYYSNSGDIDGIIIKFSPEGTLNTQFDSDGILTYNIASSAEKFNAVSIGPNGKIFAVGQSGNDVLIASYNDNGTLNTSFDADGVLVHDVNNTSIDSASAIETDQYGALMVLANTNNQFALLRFNNAGSLLSNFGGPRSYSAINKMSDLAIDSLGNVYVTGRVQIEQRWQFFVVRFPRVAGPY